MGLKLLSLKKKKVVFFSGEGVSLKTLFEFFPEKMQFYHQYE